MNVTTGFEILTQNSIGGYWQGSLARVFGACRNLMGSMQSEIRSGKLAPKTLLRGHLPHIIGGEKLGLAELVSLFDDHPLELQPSFENVDAIAGGVWLASALLDGLADDALLKLCFAAQTKELPIHSHEYSDRLIFVVQGISEFCFEQSGCQPQSIKVAPGDILMFSRGLRHTFRTSDSELHLLSYHSPFIDLDDERQFTL